MSSAGLRHVYLAHPYGGDPGNLARAEQAYAILSHTRPDCVFYCDWIHHCRAYNDANSEERELGMLRNLAQIERVDEIWAVGFEKVTISSGMSDEIIYGEVRGKIIREATIHTSPITESLVSARVSITPVPDEEDKEKAEVV